MGSLLKFDKMLRDDELKIVKNFWNYYRFTCWPMGQLVDYNLGNYKNKNCLQFLFIVKAAVLKQQISKFYPQIQRTAIFCA